MAAAELHGGGKPKLNEALGWIGSRVDDVYGANVGRLEDVWIDPGTGAPRWLLVTQGRFGGRTTLIPFEDATAGAGHVWVPYVCDVVEAAPEIQPGAPLTQHVEAALRTHYAANAPSAISCGAGERTASRLRPESGAARGQPAAATIRFQPAPADEAEMGPVAHGPRPAWANGGEGELPPGTAPMPERPVPPTAVPGPPGGAPQREGYAQPPPVAQPPLAGGYPPQDYAYAPPVRPYEYPPAVRPQFIGGWQQAAPDPAQEPIERLRELAEAGGSHYVEIELSGELTIRGQLRTVRITPRDDGRR